MAEQDSIGPVRVTKWLLVMLTIVGYVSPPFQPLIVLLVLAPWLAFGLVLRRCVLESIMSDRQADEVLLAFLFPAAALASQAFRFQFLRFENISVAILAAVIAATSFGAMVASCATSKWNGPAFRCGIVFAAIVYGTSFAVTGNSVMDRSPVERYLYEAGFKTAIPAGKYTSHGVGLRRLDPQAPFLPPLRLVFLEHSKVETGDRIGIVIHRGWLGLDWYLAECHSAVQGRGR